VETEHNCVLEILPPLWMRRQVRDAFMVGTVTSVFPVVVDRRPRWFHGHCIIDNAVCKRWPNSSS